ncbi:hypothetical protein PRIPAC_71069 [Pristionchus pacificus]|uniref:Uncharacterized protein n=1 Tax=Pristionchus pacificus TaxID=54126 RepID=A0A2A6C6K3_PRIPA|nr:hypothetical protein PRIPAC_71069 [Pristionchus pacificus]|eukprot:PDM73804.1 hypothetical protein PRIPAC_41160 [Pristionchus pacificus]
MLRPGSSRSDDSDETPTVSTLAPEPRCCLWLVEHVVAMFTSPRERDPPIIPVDESRPQSLYSMCTQTGANM